MFTGVNIPNQNSTSMTDDRCQGHVSHVPVERSRDRDRFSHGSDVPYDYISHPLLSLIQFEFKRGHLLVCLSFCIHISQKKFEGVPWCVLFSLSFCSFGSNLVCNNMPNLAMRAMRGGCSISSFFKVSFKTVWGYHWLWFALMMLIFELIITFAHPASPWHQCVLPRMRACSPLSVQVADWSYDLS